MDDSNSWIIGVILAFTGCCLSNLGINIQKLSHNKANENGELTYTKTLWYVGFVINLLGSIEDMISFKFASISLLAPIGALTLVVNLFIASCLLKEILTYEDILYTFIILSGTILSIIFGSKEESKYTVNELISLYQEPPFISFITFILIIICIIYYLLSLVSKRESKKLHTIWDIRFQSFAFPFLAGLFGAFSALFAKSFIEIVNITIEGDNQFTHIFTYAVMILLACCLVLQIKMLNKGLEKADAMLIVPVYQVFWVVMNIIASMIYFQDYHDIPWVSMFFFILGVVITLIGVRFLTTRTRVNKEKIEDDAIPESTLTSLTEHERLLNRRRARSWLLGFSAALIENDEKVNESFVGTMEFPEEVDYNWQEEQSFGFISGL